MPSFSIGSAPTPPQKKKALSKAKVSKPKTKKSSPRSTVSLSDVSGINKDLGSNEYKSMWKDPDIVLHANGITLDGIHLLSGYKEREAEWGILYYGTVEGDNDKVFEHYGLFHFNPKINLDNLGELQQVWRFSAEQEWFYKSDDEWKILRDISAQICLILGKRIKEDKHNQTMNYMKEVRETKTEDEVINETTEPEITKPPESKSFSDGKPIEMDLDF